MTLAIVLIVAAAILFLYAACPKVVRVPPDHVAIVYENKERPEFVFEHSFLKSPLRKLCIVIVPKAMWFDNKTRKLNAAAILEGQGTGLKYRRAKMIWKIMQRTWHRKLKSKEKMYLKHWYL